MTLKQSKGIHHMSQRISEPYSFEEFVAVAQIPKERATVVDLRHTGYRLFLFSD